VSASVAYPASYYAQSAPAHVAIPALAGERRSDVCVIGAGLTGLSAALDLAGRGYSVSVLEAVRVGFGASGRNGGQAWSGQRLGVLELEARLGRDLARALWELAEESKALLRQRIRHHRIRCDPGRGTLLAATRRVHLRAMLEEADHLARRYDYDQMQPLTRAEVMEAVASRRYHGGVLDHGAGHLHPLKLTLGLAAAAIEAGARIFEDSPVRRIDWHRPSIVRTPRGEVRARHVLLCANLGNARLAPQLAHDVVAIASAQVATVPLGEERARALIPAGCCVCSTGASLEYYRITGDGRLVFGAGEKLTDAELADPARLARPRLREVFPQLAGVALQHAWSGHVAVTRDRMPRFGRIAPNGLYAHGFSGHGVVLSQVVGRVLAEAVAGMAERLDVLASLPAPAFPHLGPLSRSAAVVLLAWQALRERL
jgi:gamma-glutamylputrescine oxidase